MKKALLLSMVLFISFCMGETILFLHHSCGHNLIEQGNVRFWFDSLNTANGTSHEFWDHGYNGDGLRDGDGTWLGYSWNVPEENTYACGFARIFHQPVDTTACGNFFSHVIDSSVLFAFKSCYPACYIDEDDTTWDLTDSCHQTLFNYTRLYRHIRDVIDIWPDKFFVALTPPPLVPLESDSAMGARSRLFAYWMRETFPYEGGAHPNLAVFDFWTMLAENDPTDPEFNCLREEYRNPGDPWDSHPNALANETIGPIFAAFLYNCLNDFVSVHETTPAKPNEIRISAYPNPFNSSVNINVRGVGASEARSGQVGDMKIYDINGEFIADLSVPSTGYDGGGCAVEGPTPLIWQPDENIVSGVYFIRARFGDAGSITKRIVYLK